MDNKIKVLEEYINHVMSMKKLMDDEGQDGMVRFFTGEFNGIAETLSTFGYVIELNDNTGRFFVREASR